MPKATSIETKYRPAILEKVIGQGTVVRSLENAIKKKLGSAFLFLGPSGVGKTTLSRIVATQLGCSAMDVLEVDGASETGIDDMRKVLETLMYRPLNGGCKAVIVDECHALSKQAIQALLKTLEEPPSWVYWFLCTTEPTKIPTAIKTRCLAYQLKPLTNDDLLDILESTEESKNVSDDILLLCAREAEGSARQALSNLGICMAAKNKGEAAELLRSADAAPAAFDLARALMNRSSWGEISKLLGSLKETSPESVRHVVRAYMTKVVLEPKNAKSAQHAFNILKEFSQPFHSADGVSPLVLACGNIAFNQREPF